MDIFSRVQSIIVDKLSVSPAEVIPEASFQQDLGADSLDQVELIMAVETEFEKEGVHFPDDQSDKLATVGDVVAYIEAEIAKNPQA